MGLLDDLNMQMQASRRRNRSSSSGLPFELSLESTSEVEKFARRQDKDRVKQFNEDVTAWSIHTTRRLKINVRTMIKRDLLLSDSIRPNLYYDRKYAKEVNRVGFSFVREGIYIHKGAGHGQGGFKGGSEWYNIHGAKKTTIRASLMKMGQGNRQPKEWFDPIIEQEIPQLADLIADYSATLQIDATNIFID